MTLTFRGTSYSKVDLEACLPLAQRLRAEGRHWHFHVLSPTCLHNPLAGEYALVIEDDDAATAYIAKAGETFPEVDKVLVRMLHGDTIFDGASDRRFEDTRSSRILAHLQGLQARGEPWHHHMHFPSCVFNPSPGKWSISVESVGLLVAEAFEREPVDVLREVERMYFANMDSA
ncbi:hypothetical protein ACRDNQ_02245 [Palleronia sp. KMU-117]|uniref:hypothetical protein n=1 Tax=Palleronia sp. KMU-117 TaxID=3434108 RepID=UPI003D712D6A